MQAGTQPLADFLSLAHAFAWLNVRDQEDKIALQNFLSSRLGDPVAIATGALAPKTDVPDPERFARLFCTGAGSDGRRAVSELAGCLSRYMAGLGGAEVARRL